MSRISARFEQLASKDQKALIAYVMVGYPTIGDTSRIIDGLIAGGADMIELGFPFSDPLADGPVIQDAATASINNRTDMEAFLKIVRKTRAKTDIPLALMTYANILHRAGYAGFVRRAVKAGIDGFILPDMPVDESGEYLDAIKKSGADSIFLIAPNTSKKRVRDIAKKTSGFLYLVAVYGTTGARTRIQGYTIDAIRNIKRTTRIPLAVGFGVSTPADVRRYVRAGADAVIVGSAILQMAKKTPRAKLSGAIAGYAARLKEQTV